MSVAWFRNPVLEESAAIIDRDSVNDRTFGVSKAKRHPAYVYSVNRNACLMHKVRDVEIHYYAIIKSGSHLGRLKRPAMFAHTVCGSGFVLTGERSRTCAVPLPDAVLCGRCHGKPATFRKGAASTPERHVARVKLGCEVAGYPSALAREDSK